VIGCFEQQPLLADFHPARGPVSGGTSLTLVGFHLDAGAEAMLTLSDDESLSVSCLFSDRRHPNNSVCVTSASSQPFNVTSIQFIIDGSAVPHTLPPHGFSLLPDPTVHSVAPRKTIVRSEMLTYLRRFVCALFLSFITNTNISLIFVIT